MPPPPGNLAPTAPDLLKQLRGWILALGVAAGLELDTLFVPKPFTRDLLLRRVREMLAASEPTLGEQHLGSEEHPAGVEPFTACPTPTPSTPSR